jgi:heavy metal sensor kinase
VRLDTRISLVFLVAIAAVLMGFSASIYWIVRVHLHRQLDAAAVAALDTLTASIEFTAEGLEWEPSERRLSFGAADANKSLVWGVFDKTGNHIAGAAESASMLTVAGHEKPEGLAEQGDADWNGGPWRISRRELRSDAKPNPLMDSTDPTNRRYDRLYVAAGLSLEPVAKQLRELALVLAGISITVWLIAALLGGWLCRNALAPLTEMSNSISAISPADLSQRLAPIETKDQLGELSRAFNQMLDRLQTSFERQRRFATDASHQLRTPLTSMLGHVEVALRRDRSTAEYRSVLENVQVQSVHLGQIIEMLLFLAREGADVIGADCRCFELNDWIDDYLPRWKQHPRFKDIVLDIDHEAELIIRAHQGLLGQAIDNLIDNACKYSEPKSEIIIRTFRDSDTVTLEIEDNGIGIAEPELAQVLDPFFRSEDVRRRGISGAGLGLSLTQQIVSAFGAQLSVESTLGHGSFVTITFRAESHDTIPAPALATDEANVAT